MDDARVSRMKIEKKKIEQPPFFLLKNKIKHAQCENYRIFLSLIFYVKSFGRSRSSKIVVFAALEALNFTDFVNFSL